MTMSRLRLALSFGWAGRARYAAARLVRTLLRLRLAPGPQLEAAQELEAVRELDAAEELEAALALPHEVCNWLAHFGGFLLFDVVPDLSSGAACDGVASKLTKEWRQGRPHVILDALCAGRLQNATANRLCSARPGRGGLVALGGVCSRASGRRAGTGGGAL